MNAPEKLCIFCTKFRWAEESCWGMGSTMTGPMMEGGDATCAAGKFSDWPRPRDENDWRELILRGEKCDAYAPAIPARGRAA
jgi:hypothetical protein